MYEDDRFYRCRQWFQIGCVSFLFSEFASRDLLLPDVGVVHGRMAVAAWEFGLDSVDDECIHLLMNAIEVSVLSLMFTFFVWNFIPNPFFI